MPIGFITSSAIQAVAPAARFHVADVSTRLSKQGGSGDAFDRVLEKAMQAAAESDLPEVALGEISPPRTPNDRGNGVSLEV